MEIPVLPLHKLLINFFPISKCILGCIQLIFTHFQSIKSIGTKFSKQKWHIQFFFNCIKQISKWNTSVSVHTQYIKMRDFFCNDVDKSKSPLQIETGWLVSNFLISRIPSLKSLYICLALTDSKVSPTGISSVSAPPPKETVIIFIPKKPHYKSWHIFIFLRQSIYFL